MSRQLLRVPLIKATDDIFGFCCISCHNNVVEFVLSRFMDAVAVDAGKHPQMLCKKCGAVYLAHQIGHDADGDGSNPTYLNISWVKRGGNNAGSITDPAAQFLVYDKRGIDIGNDIVRQALRVINDAFEEWLQKEGLTGMHRPNYQVIERKKDGNC